MADWHEQASRWTPASMKELVRRGATRVGCRIGKLPGVELLGAHLATLFDRLKINVVLDVGAHVGQYARFVRNIGYQGHIVSFEPVRANFAVLEQRCASDDKWTARRVALGNEAGTVPINVTNVTQFSSFLPRSGYSREEFGNLSEVVRTEMVDMRRLDSVLEEGVGGVKDPRIFLKLDTQGFDLKVLDGVGAHAEQIVALQSEIAVKPIYDGMTGYMEAIASMNDRGYELTGLFPVLRDRDLRIVEFDCVMIRSNGHPGG